MNSSRRISPGWIGFSFLAISRYLAYSFSLYVNQYKGALTAPRNEIATGTLCTQWQILPYWF
jgi:hypothetical protein